MGTAIKHPVPDRVKQAYLIFDIRTLWRSECPDVKKIQITTSLLHWGDCSHVLSPS